MNLNKKQNEKETVMKKLSFILLIAILSLTLASCDIGGVINSILGKTTEPQVDEIPNPSGLEFLWWSEDISEGGQPGAAVSGIGEWTEADLVIPDTYNDLPIVGINEHAFESNSFIVSVRMPDTTENIDFKSFYGCTALTTVHIPSSVTHIWAEAFENCSSLTDIYYGGTIEQWNSILKDNNWDFGIPSYTVHCSDGDIKLN